MAKYLVLIYGDEQIWDVMSPAERKDLEAAHAVFASRAGSRILDGHELQPSRAARTLRGAVDGRPTPTDGPFPETKEAIGGYYLIEAADLDEVTSLVEHLPEVRAAHSGVEIRPIKPAG